MGEVGSGDLYGEMLFAVLVATFSLYTVLNGSAGLLV